jgi:hypothetical protein
MDIKLNPKERKELSFKFDIEGIDEELSARLIFPMKEGLNLVYESKIVDGNVNLSIPPLSEFYKQIDASNVVMEVVSGNRRFETWKGSVDFAVEAKIAVESIEEMPTDEKSKPTVVMAEMVEVKVEKIEPLPKPEKKDMKTIFKNALK